MRTILLLLLFGWGGTGGPAQLLAQGMEDGLTVTNVAELNLARLQHQRKAMLVLGGWAVGNIGLGLALRANSSGEARRFHEMNAIWNVVNLGLASFSYYSALREPATLGAFEALQKDQGFQKILLFNAGLDVGYILGGLYLTERGRRADVDADLLRGYGKSVMLQGAFLMVFYVVNFLVASGRTEEYRLLLAPVGEGLGLRLTF